MTKKKAKENGFNKYGLFYEFIPVYYNDGPEPDIVGTNWIFDKLLSFMVTMDLFFSKSQYFTITEISDI